MEHNNRRKFLKNSLLLAAIPAIAPFDLFAFGNNKGDAIAKTTAPFVFSQIPLPYAYDALAPHIDAMTMEIHYTKHHATYVKNVNEAIKAENLNFKNEADFFARASKLSPKVRNNGGGVWNHNFFWESMTQVKTLSGAPTGNLKVAIDKSFGSVDQFKEQFSKAALGQFGSGWAWLISDKGQLKIVSTPNQDNPLMDNSPVKGVPLLAIDVWEHAYYLKYQNKRNEYIAAWWNVVNWDQAEKRFSNKA